MNLRVFAALAFGLSLAGFSTTQAADAPSFKPIDFKIYGDKILLNLSINGKSATALMDSGSELSIIDQNFANQSGISSHRGSPQLSTEDGKIQSRASDRITLTLADQTSIGVSPVQVDLSKASVLFGKPIDLVIGDDIISQVALFISFTDSQIYLLPKGAQPTGFTRVPLHFQGRAPIVPIVVGQQNLNALVDLGADQMQVLPKTWDRIKPAGAIVTDEASASAKGVIEIHPQSRLPVISIGGFDAQKVPVGISPLPGDIGDAADAVISLTNLTLFDIELDYSTHSLWLKPRPNPPAPRIEKAGLEITPSGVSGVVVHIATGSPAQNGAWRIGDRVCAIDGVEYKQVRPEWKYGADGKVVQIALCDGSLRSITLRTYY